MDWADSASLQSLSLQPLPTFFSLSLTWLLTWLLPSLPQWLSLHLFHSLSSTHSLHPRGATNLYCLCCHSVSLLLFLSVCLPACLPLSLSLSLFPSIVFLSLSCSKAAAPHSGLRGYDKERPQIHARAHSCTPTQTDISHIVTALSGFSKPLLKKVTVFPLWIPLILFHTTVESFAFQIKKIKKALQKNKNKKKHT